MAEKDTHSTVILGSGIVGLCTAYYLSQLGRTKPEHIHLVDPLEQLFHCASGYAGGFLAADWFSPSVAPFGLLSFQLHAHLAEKHNGRQTWGYTPSTGLSYNENGEEAVGGSGEDFLANGTSRAQAAAASLFKEEREKEGEREVKGPVWLKSEGDVSWEVISQDTSTAQIDPWKFCRFLLGECKKRGVKVHQPAKAVSITKDENNCLTGILISHDDAESEIQCTRLVLASGAWTPRVFTTLFPQSSTQIPIEHLAGHSLLLKNPFHKTDTPEETCHAVFATDTLDFSPEWFSRAGGEVYLAGLNTRMIPLPEVPSEAKPKEEAVQKLKECARVMMGGEVEAVRQALCFRGTTTSGRPIVSRIPDHKLGGGLKTKGGANGGVFVAAGHGAWGITQAPATGLCLAELMEGMKPSADIAPLALP